ncbi:Hypothetical protein BQ3484_105, partial [Cedratvirus A11]
LGWYHPNPSIKIALENVWYRVSLENTLFSSNLSSLHSREMSTSGYQSFSRTSSQIREHYTRGKFGNNRSQEMLVKNIPVQTCEHSLERLVPRCGLVSSNPSYLCSQE